MLYVASSSFASVPAHLLCQPYDPIVRMRSANALYGSCVLFWNAGSHLIVIQGFVQVSRDALWVQPSLVGNVSTFMATHSHLLPPHANHAFSWNDVGKVLSGNGENKDWTLETFYVRRSLPVCERSAKPLLEQFRNLTSQRLVE